MISPPDVLAVERAYAAAGASIGEPTPGELRTARACAGAVASRYLAVGTPRSFGIVVDDATRDDAAASLAAHRTWFQPRDLRCTADALTGARVVSLDEALACDIVCIHIPLVLTAAQLRRGTHVNALVPEIQLDLDLHRKATIADEHRLALMAAGKLDGRQLDEITIFVASGLAIALATCSPSPSHPST